MKIMVLLLLTAILSGCVGFGYSKPIQSKYVVNEESRKYYKVKPPFPTGSHKVASEKRFCGVVLFIGIPFPLGLPVCEEYNEYVYQDGVVVQVNNQRVNGPIYACGPLMWVFGIAHGYKPFTPFCGKG